MGLRLLGLILLFSLAVRGQHHSSIDSLENQLKATQSPDPVMMGQLAYEYAIMGEHQKALKLIQRAVSLADSLDPQKLAVVYNFYGTIYSIHYSNDSAFIMYNKALELLKGSNEYAYICGIYVNLGNTYGNMEAYANALECYLKALQIAEDHDLPKLMLYLNIAVAYQSTEQLRPALEYDSLAMREAVALNDEEAKFTAMADMGGVLVKLKQYAKAEKLLEESLTYFEKAGAVPELVDIYMSLGFLSSEKNARQKAIQYFHNALAIATKTMEVRQLLAVSHDLAENYFQVRQMDNAAKYAKYVLHVSDSLHMLQWKVRALNTLTKISIYRQDLDGALQYENLHTQFNDSLRRLDAVKNMMELEARYATEKKEKENEILRQERLLQEAKISQQQIIILCGVILVALLIVVLFLLNRTNQIRRSSNVNLQNKNNEILQQQEEILAQKGEIERQNTELTHAMEELRATQDQLVQSEKLSSIGLLTAGIAHEINNPINFIKNGVEGLKEMIADYDRLIDEYENAAVEPVNGTTPRRNHSKINYQELRQEVKEIMNAIQAGTRRTSSIVSNLQKFSRKDSFGIEYANLAQLMEETLSLLQGELKGGIKVIREYEEIPAVLCNPQELNQVFLNILINAIHAMNGVGELRIAIRMRDGMKEVEISDTGPGIPVEIRQKIFDPFFTTKDVGKGTGLGLSISHSLVKNNGGHIQVSGEEGKGASFTIVLP